MEIFKASSLLGLLQNFYFWKGHWTLGYVCVHD